LRILIFIEKLLLPLFWILISFSFDLPHVAVLTALAALIHEIGHLLPILRLRGASVLFKGRVSGPKISVAGLSYREELEVVSGGPIANLFSCILLVPLMSIAPSRCYVLEFIFINLLTAASNLLPIRGFDGYKLLSCLAAESRYCIKLEAVLYWMSFIITSALALIALYFILRLGEGYWGFVLFLSIILSEIKKREKHSF